MYIIFSILAALIGGGFSVFMRMELMEPGVQYMADGHMWNVFTTAHGLIMVFFVVMPAHWWFELVCADNDRRSRYGLSAHE